MGEPRLIAVRAERGWAVLQYVPERGVFQRRRDSRLVGSRPLFAFGAPTAAGVRALVRDPMGERWSSLGQIRELYADAAVAMVHRGTVWVAAWPR